MRMYDIILKKRMGKSLSKDEIAFFVNGYTAGDIPDYQVSALLMAIFLKKMDIRETVDLTYALMRSGDMIDLSAIEGVKVDKHSTGGVGDTTTLIVAPMVASCGVPVAKMSGRGLGHTGGTLDKLEAIDGFKIKLSSDEFIDIVNKNKIAVVGQTTNIAPADKKLYALRDVTATVDDMSLIAASVMSKKLAAGAGAIVLDVKCGSGAFAKSLADAKLLAKIMVDIGTQMDREVIAVITDMSQPLGFSIGNALEVKEAVTVLKGECVDDITELCLVLASQMVALGKGIEVGHARELVEENFKNGNAYKVFKKFISAQGGNIEQIEDLSSLKSAKYTYEIKSVEDGYISKMQSDEIGNCAMLLGAGRETKDDIIDMGAGIVLNKKLGDLVKKDDILAVFHTDKFNNIDDLEEIKNRFISSFTFSKNKPKLPELIQCIITRDGEL